MENADKKMSSVTGFFGQDIKKKLEFYSKKYKLPMSRLIAIAVDNELAALSLEDEYMPFYWDMKLPAFDSFPDLQYADEAGRLVKYMKRDSRGMSLDLLLVLRHDIGIPDRDRLKFGLVEALRKNLIEVFENPASVKYENVRELYRLKQNNPITKKKRVKKETEKELFLKLQKKYGKKNG